MSVRARMKVVTVNEQGTQVAVGMTAVYSSDPADPNYSFSQATPSGQLSLTITNPAAFYQFVLGDTYDLDFTKVVESSAEVPPAPEAPAEPPVAEAPVEEAPPNEVFSGTSTGFPTPPSEVPTPEAASAPVPAPSEAVESTEAPAGAPDTQTP